jgi:hypothetical protein
MEEDNYKPYDNSLEIVVSAVTVIIAIIGVIYFIAG